MEEVKKPPDISLDEKIIFEVIDSLELETESKKRKPFWDKKISKLSEEIWIPKELEEEKIDNGNSWFSITEKHPKNSKRYIPPEGYTIKNINPKEKVIKEGKRKPVDCKTLKLRIFPNKEERDELEILANQQRWYYNQVVNLFTNEKDTVEEEKLYSFYKIRNFMMKCEYSEEHNILFYNEAVSTFPSPSWWKNIHNRTPRGAIKKFSSAISSAFSNRKGKGFQMHFKSKKSLTDNICYEDGSYPNFINQIKNRYWYTTKDRKRKQITLEEIKKLDKSKRGLEIIKEKLTDRYFILYPVAIDWLPKDDKRVENQDLLFTPMDSIISLDPGVRKFLVGYDPEGDSVFIGLERNKLMDILNKIDDLRSKLDISMDINLSKRLRKRIYILWKKSKNMVRELHWKTINYLMRYNTILLPEFRVSEMLKGKTLPRSTKRILQMYSFCSFREKMKWMCKRYQKNLYFVNEDYTSKTCGCCGKLNDVKCDEVYNCKSCLGIYDRDLNGARNIFLKNLKLRLA